MPDLLSTMASLKKKYPDADISVAAVQYRPDLPNISFELCPDTVYMGASIGKLGIAFCAARQVERGVAQWSDQLELRQEHIRGGTGLLRAFPVGIELSMWRVFQLMLIESDNTAANVLLSHLGSQRDINSLLNAWGVESTGLADRTDRLFESTEMTASGGLRLVSLLDRRAPLAMAVLRRNHYVDGLRGMLEHHGRWSRNRYRIFMVLGKPARFFGPVPVRFLLSRAVNRRSSPLAATKEGILDLSGDSYRHNAGRLDLPGDDGYMLISVFTRNAGPEVLPEIGNAAIKTLSA